MKQLETVASRLRERGISGKFKEVLKERVKMALKQPIFRRTGE